MEPTTPQLFPFERHDTRYSLRDTANPPPCSMAFDEEEGLWRLSCLGTTVWEADEATAIRVWRERFHDYWTRCSFEERIPSGMFSGLSVKEREAWHTVAEAVHSCPVMPMSFHNTTPFRFIYDIS